mmetsp:Transcript_24465/g.33729  ORF Transcript_24465/g.33729 Transcript_24465/m.33729 type:complete len:187 (+) Transcript_24465:163-723(+)|eukprot:CAMPEP_0196587166 /NCGR_PEP_ID=MMETSP1081-20130531/56624_1 /TAXON_ID=36882 /ORGANISM="Pyramimonas amylifera, Strain CCMP720" /LENGTH=186 /DNA_ID=CAMNT_0041909271 /DNA_START=162 /DNA_END=722 /DNA_ORIENTATION=+
MLDETVVELEAAQDPKPNLDALRGVHFLSGLFPEPFLQMLRDLRWKVPGSTSSHNMYATRHFLCDPDLAEQLRSYLPKNLQISHVLSDMRVIDYPAGGYIAPHVDGVRTDAETGVESTTSFLLYLEDVPEGEGGETEFLTSIERDGDVLWSVRPKSGNILIFPHNVPHQGAGVGNYPKVMLRGDMY